MGPAGTAIARATAAWPAALLAAAAAH